MISLGDGAEEKEETNYWNPTSNILLVFIMLMFIVFAVSFAFKGSTGSFVQQTGQVAPINAEEKAALEAREMALADKEKSMADREAAMKELAGIRTVMINELTHKLSSLELPIEIDKASGNIRFTEAVLFDINNDTLNAEGQQYLNVFVPVYLSVLLSNDYEKYLDQIIIEGHADIDGGYRSNLFLSQNRANSVVNFILAQELTEMSNGVSAAQYLTVSARSHNAPVLVNGVPNRSRSRRVEFVFRLKDDALLQKMQDIFTGEE